MARLQLAIVLLAALTPTVVDAVEPRPPQARFIRQGEFSIPFKISGLGGDAPQPLEVQLHVSSDRGASWRVHAAVAPDERRFAFRAPGDGEYWFLVRTKYPMGVLRPDGPPRAELIVVVDTAPPRLELAASVGSGGEVHVEWRTDDANPRADGLKIEYRCGDSQAGWRPVAVDGIADPASFEAARYQGDPADRATATAPGPRRGELTFVPEDSSAGIVVRAEVVDRPGNRAVSQATAVRQNADEQDPTGTQSAGLPGRIGATGAAHRPADPPGETVATPPADDRGHAGGASTLPARWPAEPTGDTALDPAAEVVPPRMSDAFPSRDDPTGDALLPEPKASRGATAGRTAGRPDLAGPANAIDPPASSEKNSGELDEPGEALDESSDAASGSGNYSQFDPRAEAGAFQGELLPAGVRPRWVNSRRFELEYEVDSVGPSGVAKVELWGTRDGGETWKSFGIDDDGRSPITVSVEGEGVYGFRMVVETATGLRTAMPEEGDSPDVWVAIDLTRPAARLVAAEQGSGREAGDLVIRWEAADQLLAQRPISLWFAPAPGGPWTPIASGLENTGYYAWRLDHRVPDNVYLRLEVRDAAGNAHLVDTSEVVSIDAARPRGHIRGVRPLSDAARRTKLIYNLFR